MNEIQVFRGDGQAPPLSPVPGGLMLFPHRHYLETGMHTVLGGAGSGKTAVLVRMMFEWLSRHPNKRALILDGWNDMSMQRRMEAFIRNQLPEPRAELMLARTTIKAATDQNRFEDALRGHDGLIVIEGLNAIFGGRQGNGLNQAVNRLRADVMRHDVPCFVAESVNRDDQRMQAFVGTNNRLVMNSDTVVTLERDRQDNHSMTLKKSRLESPDDFLPVYFTLDQTQVAKW